MSEHGFDLLPIEAAEIVGVHRDTITRWADEGRLPCWKTPGGQRRFRRSDVEALLSEPEPEQVA